MLDTSFFSVKEIEQFGFKSYGQNLLISRLALFVTPGEISIGNNVRIDPFCILSGSVNMGSYIHISAYTAFYARYGLVIGDFATISGRVMIYTQNDDYSGNFMTNPMVPKQYTNVTGGQVTIGKHAIIAAGSIILPSVNLGEGACIGAMSLVKEDADPWTIYAGVPSKRIKPRSQKILDFENLFICDQIR